MSERTQEQKAEEQRIRDLHRQQPIREVSADTLRGSDAEQLCQFIASIRREREAQGLTIEQLAARAGVDAGVLTGFESGQAFNPTVSTLYRIAAGLGLNLSLALEGDDGAAALAIPPGRRVQRGPRTDESGRAYAGSQLQIQIYVNRRQDLLNQAILGELAGQVPDGATIRWVSPLESDSFREYFDGPFLDRLGLTEERDKLPGFWPRSGPRWDALGVIDNPSGEAYGYLLVEAKSYPDEIRGPGCQADPGSASRCLIEQSLQDTKLWTGAAGSADWTGSLYQSANRLAHLYFLRERAGKKAWLVNLCFLNDKHCPHTPERWHAGLTAINTELGFGSGPRQYVIDLFLEARLRPELLEPTTPTR